VVATPASSTYYAELRDYRSRLAAWQARQQAGQHKDGN
jgi:hypothetical protein